MTVFGELDTEEVSEVPETGTYLFVLSGIFVGESTFDGRTYTTFNMRMDEPGNDHNGLQVKKKFWMPQSPEDAADPPYSNQTAVQAINAYRAWVRGLGVPKELQDEELNLDELKGARLKVYGAKYEGQNGTGWSPRNVSVA